MPTFPPIRGLSPLCFGGDIRASQLYFVHTLIDLKASNALDLTVPSLCKWPQTT
jgi:hypothetical protein